MDEENLFAKIRAQRDWERARQAAILEEILGAFSPGSVDLLSFEDVKRRLRLGQKNYKGLQDIEISRIRGSVGRYRDFTRTFLPRREDLRERWQRVDAVAVSRGYLPIEVYQVGEAYFVLDGNHRVSVARQNGASTIQAHVWEFPTPAGLSAQADLDELLIKAEYADFLEHTRLDETQPDLDIQFTAPGHYRELEYQIALYRQVLEKIDGEPISYPEAAAAWYEMIYTPAVQIIQQRGILKRFPGRTEADLFIWVWQHHKELKARGIASLSQAADEVARASSPLRRLWERFAGWLRRGRR